jgi:signal transduction histidine kinase
MHKSIEPVKDSPLPMISEGSAFVDRTGRILASEPAFRSCLRLPGEDPSRALSRRAAADPVLSGLLAGSGPDRVQIRAHEGVPECELTRVTSDAGLLLHAWTPIGAGVPSPAAEYAMLALSLARLAGSVAHEVKNPLNAMALQLALLGDKIATASDTLASACAGNLASLKNQIGRVNDVVRRFVDVADPTPSGAFDGASLLTDVANLFAHDGRRRRVAVSCEAAAEGVHASGDPARAARLLLGIIWRAVTATPEGGRLVARASSSGTEVVLAVEHGRGTPDPTLSWTRAVIAAAAVEMGGHFDESSSDDIMRAALVLPRERPL